MKRYLKLGLILLVASCGGRHSAPRNLDNACAILKERPAYHKAMKKAQKRWGVPINVQMATIHQESKFIGDARTPHKYVLGVIPMGRQSSAFGYAQALDDTWDEYRKDEGRWGADRDDIGDATDFMGWYMAASARGLGISLSDARSQYLAYHEGRTGFARGSYNDKAWLVAVADRVADRSIMYRNQLASCGKL